MFLKNVSATHQNFTYNDGKRQLQIAPGGTAALIDAREDDPAIQTLVSLGFVEIVDGKPAEAPVEEVELADLVDDSETVVLSTVNCPATFKNGNPCNSVVQLAEGESYEDAPHFCGRHKDENPDDYMLVDGKWKKAAEKAPEKPAKAPEKPAAADAADADAGGDAGDVVPPLVPSDMRPVFDND